MIRAFHYKVVSNTETCFAFQSSRMLMFGFLVVLVSSAVVALVVLIAIAGNGSHQDHDNHHH